MQARIKEYIAEVEDVFRSSADPEIAAGQKAYMKGQFEYYGLKSPVRKELQKPFLLRSNLPTKEEMQEIVRACWQKPYREMHYFALELADKFKKNVESNDISFYEELARANQWWDTIDYIAPRLMAEYFKTYPEKRKPFANKWIDSGDFWMNRCAILFQLKYKKDLDTELLEYIINRSLGSKEFFINKAIGWILREYGKVNPKWVVDFANRTELHSLSRREGLRIIEN